MHIMNNFQLALQVSALILASVSLLVSIYRVYLKTRAEKKLENLMHEKERENMVAIRVALEGARSFQEKEQLMLSVILKQLDDDEKDAIMKSFNKKTSSDQRRYLDKLIEESGSESAYKEFLVNA